MSDQKAPKTVPLLDQYDKTIGSAEVSEDKVTLHVTDRSAVEKLTSTAELRNVSCGYTVNPVEFERITLQSSPPPPGYRSDVKVDENGVVRDLVTNRITYPGPPFRPRSGTYQHNKEAFCLMLYRDSIGNEEWVWNSRDGVTPFCMTSPEGFDSRHVEWQRDRCVPNHVPAVGDRIFVDLTIERAREFRRAYVERCQVSGPILIRYESKEHAIAELAEADMQEGGGGAPDIVVVTADMLERKAWKR